MHKHRAITKNRTTEDYQGPVAHPSKPEAHGGKRQVDVCSCGATRRTNVNGKAREQGPWIEPKTGRSGTVWNEEHYTAAGYAPRINSIRFETIEAYNGLKKLADQAGKTRTQVLEGLVLREVQKKSA
jgi:hypothetical protein